MTSQPRLLVTGAGGSIGRRLRARLDSDGIEASYIVSPTSGALLEDPLVDAIDVTDRAGVNAVVAKRQPTAIIHLAAITGAACDADEVHAHEVNVEAVRSLAELAQDHGVSRFVLASTSAVYGDQYDTPVSETGELVLDSRYAQMKRQAELILAAAADSSSRFSAVALRVFNVYGPGMVGSLANRLMEANEASRVTLAGLDDFVRDYIHVDDVADALVRAALTPLTVPWLIANVGSGRPMSNRDLVAALEPVHFTTAEPRASYSCANTEVAHRTLGFIAGRKLTRSSVS